MTATVSELHPGTRHPEDDLGKAFQAARNALAEAETEALRIVERADEDASAAMVQLDLAEDALEDHRASTGFVVTEAATRIHDRQKHAGTLALCADETCMIWADLLREQGWGA